MEGELGPGLMQNTDIINSLPEEVFRQLCHECIKHLRNPQEEVSVGSLHLQCELEGHTCSEQSLHGAATTLTQIFRKATKCQTSSQELKAILTKTYCWNEKAAAQVEQTWSQQETSITADGKTIFNIGKLIDVKWKMGMTTSSSDCKNIHSPFVTMVLKFSDPSGSLQTRSFELTLPEFRKFSQQMQEMASVLETV